MNYLKLTQYLDVPAAPVDSPALVSWTEAGPARVHSYVWTFDSAVAESVRIAFTAAAVLAAQLQGEKRLSCWNPDAIARHRLVTAGPIGRPEDLIERYVQ